MDPTLQLIYCNKLSILKLYNFLLIQHYCGTSQVERDFELSASNHFSRLVLSILSNFFLRVNKSIHINLVLNIIMKQ